MTDSLGFGAMLFGPEHALQVAADAIEANAKSPDMGVGIVLGIKAALVEYQRLFTSAPNPPAASPETTQDLTKKDPKDKAGERVAGLSRR